MYKALRFMLVSLLTMLCGTVMADQVTMKYSGTITANMTCDGNEAATFGLNASEWSVTADKGTANNAPGLNKAGDVRLYRNADGSNTITVSSLTEATINNISMTFNGATYNNVTVTVNGNPVTADAEGVYTINSTSFVLGNGSTSNTQVRIKEVVIDYTPAGTPSDTRTATTISAGSNQEGIVGTTMNLPAAVVKAGETAIEGAVVTWTSSDVEVAKIDGTTLQLLKAGTATITASFEGDENYKPCQDSFTLTVKEAPTTVTNIAELTALENNKEFVFTGEALIVAKPTDKHVYITDATGAALIYTISENSADAAVGKTIAGNWTGKVSIYKKLFELVPDAALVMKDGEAVAVEYPEVAAADITAENVNKVVTLKGITSYTVSDKNMTIKVGETEIVGYNQFGLTIADAEEGKTYEIVGAIGRYNDNIQFQPIEIKEQVEETPEPDPEFYIVGTMTNWQIDPNYKMTLNEKAGEGIKEFSVTMTLAAGDEFKAVSSTDGTTIKAYFPDGMENNYVISEAGEYDIYFRPNADGGEDWHYDVIYAAKKEAEPVLNTYTATFTTNAEWEKVYAYVWSGEGENKVLGDWPGTELTATEGVYTVTIKADAAPEFIIFNNGITEGEGKAQTANLPFVHGKAYVYPFVAVDCTAKVTDNWLSEQGSVGGPVTLEGVEQKEQYNGSTTNNIDGDVLYQIVEGLENGTYTVELYANASYTEGRGFTSDAQNGDLGRTIVYAGNVEKTIPVIYQTWVDTNNTVTLENVVVSDGTLRMGLRKNLGGSNWHTIKIKALTQTDEAAVANTTQDEYWKGVAATMLDSETYANVAGVEKAGLTAAETKTAVQEALVPFFAAKAAYDALVKAIADADAAGVDAADAKAVLAAAETTAADAAEALHLVKLAVNTKAVEGATEATPVETNFVVNGTFDTNGNIVPWQATGGFQNQTTANNQQGAFTGNFFENWNGSAKVNKMYQVIEDIPNGKYTLKICAFVNTLADPNESQFVFANNDKTFLTTSDPTAYEVKTIVTNNKIEIGLEQTTATANWMGIDNVSLLYAPVDLTELINAYNTAKAAAQAVEGKMNKDVKDALERALAANVNMEDGDSIGAATAALTEATAAATASVAAFANATNVLPKMKELTESTNVYTAEALAEYYTQWLEKYEAETLTTDEGNALQDPNVVTGWHNSITVDNFLLSAWDTEADKFEGYYINSWSTEGNNDGSEFKVPFFEYWTSNANSLGEKTMTATMNNLPEGKYDVTAWVRVRIKDGAEAPAYGITFQANEGEAVNVTGDQVGESQMYLKEVTATGTVAEDGVLKIQFVVAADNNISWLSFKNVKFTKQEEPVEYFLVGNMNEWNINDNYKLALNEEAGVEEYMITLDLEANTELKVKSNKGVWYPDGENNNFTINDAGNYTIYFQPNFNAEWNGYIFTKKNEAPQPATHTWDFTKWSEETVANLKAEAAKVQVEDMGEGKTNLVSDNGALWSDHEKTTQTDPSKYNTTYAASKDNCFWYIGGQATPTANGTAIAEFEGLEFNTNYGTKRSLAIAVNYPATTLGEYHGPAYLWFGGKNSEILTIKNVKPGTTIKMGVESHKTTDARGVQLLIDGAVIEGPAAPKTYEDQEWTIPASENATVDVVVKNTNGCHIYYIDAEIDNTATGISTLKNAIENGTVYNMNGQKVNKAQKGLYIINGRKVVIK